MTQKWMRGASASARGALLGLALERPGHSYELATRLAVRFGDATLSSDVYRVLKQLVGLGLLNRSSDRGRTVYRPTDLTEQAFLEWLKAPIVPELDSLSALCARVASARSEDANRLVGMLHEYEQACQRQLLDTTAPVDRPSTWESLRIVCVQDARSQYLHQQAAWARQTLERITAFLVERPA